MVFKCVRGVLLFPRHLSRLLIPRGSSGVLQLDLPGSCLCSVPRSFGRKVLQQQGQSLCLESRVVLKYTP